MGYSQCADGTTVHGGEEGIEFARMAQARMHSGQLADGAIGQRFGVRLHRASAASSAAFSDCELGPIATSGSSRPGTILMGAGPARDAIATRSSAPNPAQRRKTE
ncbi:hypothetical protein [Variovorax sp. PBL-E5]|uniref:hypothetical protein n=1 Tax=Variovorax sp. PBL-E5 TaxID=434014 RepID=UPI0013A55354|nr:hypothetical protein [Variovorax sp. PBL-E5]